jgi:DNA-binding NarL/FixJ family response regulator
MIRILVVDDHPIVRAGLKQIIAEESDMAVPGEARSAQEALELARKEEWDVVVLDIGLPGQSGLETLKELKRSWPTLPVLILSVYPEDQFAVRSLRAGAAGYMTKESAPEELVLAIRKVVSGGKHITQAVAERLALQIERDSGTPPHESLSDREYEVLRLIASGKTVNQIAGQLSLSVKTISTYRARILEKLELKTSAELIRYAIRQRLVE